uniref:2,3-bisphosphoglycerate-independent phosphoglycerate mutase n=1 Tax=Magnetococcus massalia (strain MO-1) TaxID=451514 RepID=A0A1S7LMF3_MAGMO|nr:phosphoglycero mutase III, cofactor-independent [Candidatus Magnetococcus massalia]
MSQQRPKPMTLVILDGWGLRDAAENNAIREANTPNMDDWMQNRPFTQVRTSARDVGLPDGQMGNSEVGHLNLGAGRVVYQDYTRVDCAVEDGSFFENSVLIDGVKKAVAKQGAVHILGLLSPGGVHSHQNQILAAIRAAKQQGAEKIFIHAFLDGRDTPPKSAKEFMAAFEAGLQEIGAGRVATVSGRYFAMDRDKRWERVEKGYRLMVMGDGVAYESAETAIQTAYDEGKSDEFIEPCVIVEKGQPIGKIQSNDTIICMNFRADRVREISHAFTDPAGDFDGFDRGDKLDLAAYICLTEYDVSLKDVAIMYPPEELKNILGHEMDRHGLKQLRAAETEKYAHVTYFFNGGKEEPCAGEDRLLIPSPKVATYDMQPEMSAQQLTDELLGKLEGNPYDLLVVNYANPDMVGHTGQHDAAVTAIETVDAQLGRLADAILQMGGELLITADHGNADQMVDALGRPHTAHTTNPAPLIYLGRNAELAEGRLSDIAPTLLELMGLPKPAEMDGESLVTLAAHAAA